MPHGFQWSLDEIRNAERMAQIQAEAVRQAMRKELQSRPTPASSVYTPPQPKPEPVRRGRVKPKWPKIYQKSKPELSTKEYLAEGRAVEAKGAQFGSRYYIEQRYGKKVFNRKAEELSKQQGCSLAEAENRLVSTYSEESWIADEDELVERFLGNR